MSANEPRPATQHIELLGKNAQNKQTGKEHGGPSLTTVSQIRVGVSKTCEKTFATPTLALETTGSVSWKLYSI